jgi:hypothetical protein
VAKKLPFSLNIIQDHAMVYPSKSN